jgi:hypothetical protein
MTPPQKLMDLWCILLYFKFVLCISWVTMILQQQDQPAFSKSLDLIKQVAAFSCLPIES